MSQEIIQYPQFSMESIHVPTLPAAVEKVSQEDELAKAHLAALSAPFLAEGEAITTLGTYVGSTREAAFRIQSVLHDLEGKVENKNNPNTAREIATKITTMRGVSDILGIISFVGMKEEWRNTYAPDESDETAEPAPQSENPAEEPPEPTPEQVLELSRVHLSELVKTITLTMNDIYKQHYLEVGGDEATGLDTTMIEIIECNKLFSRSHGAIPFELRERSGPPPFAVISPEDLG